MLLLEYHIQTNPPGFTWTKLPVFSEQVSPNCPKKACECSLISEEHYTFPMLAVIVAELGWKYHSSSVWRYVCTDFFHQSGNAIRLAGNSKRGVRLFNGK